MRFLKPVLFIFCLLLVSCSQKPAPTTSRDISSEEDPWTTWYRKKTKIGGLLALSRIREEMNKGNLHDPHIDYKAHAPVKCDEDKMKYRSADGTCYYKDKPHVGAAGVAFGRNIAPEFIDEDAKENLMVPNPALVSKEFFTRDEFKPVPFLNMLAASWIQFMNHDWLTHGKNDSKKPYHIKGARPEVAKVERTKVNTLDEDQYKEEFGKTTTNDVTHWWDGSQLYGSNQDEQNKVRSFSKGKMKLVKFNGRELLPTETIDPRTNIQNMGTEVTGFKDNWWVGLSMLHHLFVKEHNAIAKMLFKKYVRGKNKEGKWRWTEGYEKTDFANRRNNPTQGKTRKRKHTYYTDKELDEHIFQVSRLINAAVMSKIHTVEWTPAILANDTLKIAMFTNWYGLANPQTWGGLFKKFKFLKLTDWSTKLKIGQVLGGLVGEKRKDYGVPYSITEEFTSVYRLHPLLPEELNIRKTSSKNRVEKIHLADTRNEKSYPLMKKYPLKDLFYSFGTQHPGQLVLNNHPNFMQNLEIPSLGKMDLAMVDIFRDRERGVPRYNQFRRAIGLRPISTYRDFFPRDKELTEAQKKIIGKFNKVYGKDSDGNDNVEMIDLIVGYLAEEVRPDGFGFGETQFQIFIVMASRRLMADRFYTENYTREYYTKEGLKWIDREGFFSNVILRHMPQLKKHIAGLETPFNPWNK